ncbi:hypothetical protein Bpfe_022032, partial [Biomphalaria pfeifferi]
LLWSGVARDASCKRWSYDGCAGHVTGGLVMRRVCWSCDGVQPTVALFFEKRALARRAGRTQAKNSSSMIRLSLS